MRVPLKRLACCLLAALAAGLLAARADEPAAKNKERVAALIRDLGSDDYTTREIASAELLKQGEPALAALKAAAATTKSLEARERANQLIHDITVWGGPRKEIHLADVFEQVKLACRAKDSAKACADGRLEKLLVRWERVLGDAAAGKDRPLPIQFDQVRFAEHDSNERHGGGIVTNKLLIGKRIQTSIAQYSILLADESVEVSSAQNCIIIARIAARVSNSTNCLIISGCTLEVSIDNGSALLCAGDANFSIINDSICAVGGQLQTSIPKNVTAVNSQIANRPGREINRTVRVPELRVEGPGAASPLADRIDITSGFREGDGIALFRLANGKGEYVARYGQKINDPDGRPIAELAGWTLRYANERLTVFSNGDDFCMLRIPAPR